MAGRLGKGLDSLLSESSSARQRRMDAEGILSTPTTNNSNGVVMLKLEDLEPSIYQPRKNFDQDALVELAQSIQEHGLLEPLLVRKNQDKYEIICGERRYRASKIAGLTEVPCLIKDILESQSYAIALIENIQREDLNPVEYAFALLQMLNECEMTQDQLAKTLGKSRATIANLIRINNLADEVKDALGQGFIDLGHAKVLLSLDKEIQAKACEVVIKKGFNVRQTELYVKSLKEDDNTKPKFDLPEYFKNYERLVSNKLEGAKVKFSMSDEDKGKITLNYSSQQQLSKILELFGLKN